MHPPDFWNSAVDEGLPLTPAGLEPISRGGGGLQVVLDDILLSGMLT